MTSHSNYPPREIFFDSVTFGQIEERPVTESPAGD